MAIHHAACWASTSIAIVLSVEHTDAIAVLCIENVLHGGASRLRDYDDVTVHQ